MATKRKNKLQIFMERYGIGEKGLVQKQIESDPYLKWINSGMRSTDYTPEIAAAKRRFIEKQQGAKQQPTYRDTGNVVRIETIEDTVPSERARPRPVTTGGMGGYSQGGLFTSDRGMGVVPDNVDTTSAPPDAPTDLLDAALYESDRYFGTRSPGDEMTAAWQAEQLRRRRAEAPYDLVTAAAGRNPTVVTSGYPARDFSRDPYLGGAGAGGLEMTRAAQRQAELNSASMDMPRGLFGNTWSTSTGTAPYSAERNWGQPGVYIGGGSPGEEIQAEMQRQAALESAGMDFNLPLNGSTYQTTTGTAPTPPVTNWGQTAFPYIGQSGAGGEEMSRAMDAMPPEPPAIVQELPKEAIDFRRRLGAGFGGGSGADIQASRAQLVEPQFSERFTNYLQKVEGLKTDTGKTPFRYKSAEGGNDTVGIGHKLTDAEVKSGKVYGYDLKTLTKEQVQDILQKDLDKTKSVLSKNLTNKYKKSFEDLTPKQQEMLLDLQFNVKDSGKGGGILEFPKFTEALLKNDLETMRKEYKRYYTDPETKKNVSLGRNKDFFNTYLK